MFKQLLEFQARNEKTMIYEFKNIHAKIDGNYSDLNNKHMQLASHLKALESQVAYMPSSSKQPIESLPGKPEKNPKESCNVVFSTTSPEIELSDHEKEEDEIERLNHPRLNPDRHVSPSSVTPSRRVTRSQSASDREAIPKKISRAGKTRTRYEDEGGDPKWKKEVLDPRIDNLVRRMREGHEFKATDFRGGDSSLPPLKAAEKAEGVGVKKKCQKPSRRFGKACDEPGSSSQAPERPIRPRRGICKQAEPGNLSDKEQELKEWIRVELKTQLGKLRNEIFDWLHHDRGGSSTVPQNTAAGKTNRDNGHADPTGMEVPKKRRPFSGDGNDEAEIFGSDSKKHKKNNGDGFSDDETMRMHDNHCDGRTPNARFWEKSANIPEVDVSTPIGPETVSKPAKPTLPEPLEGEGGDGSPISGLNLLAEEVEKGTRSDNVYKDPQENTCRMLTVWSHPESYVLPPEEQGGKASPTNSEDYKTPPEDDPMTESRTPDVGNSKLSRYLTRSLKKAELEGKCIPISSTKKDDLQTKRIPRRSTKIGGSILRETPAQEFEIVIGIHVSNKFFLSLTRPTNWVSTEFAEFEKTSDKLGFNWGGLVSHSFTGKTPRRNDKKVLLVDVDRVYAPMMWGKDHWVGLVINLTCRQVEILDCNIPRNESDKR
ncbi:BnaA01g36320D [Brassica napus]|uniref:BnaA01g36320D protein n=1 Tax=Brassica napus TaxID=3708 RepID=A0A078IWA8_BRANA|nr:BnaA01g36320D [Brassica napus]